MRRREFIALVAGAALAWPLAARAQQAAAPVIGFLGNTSLDHYAARLRAFAQGLSDSGYVEGQNVAIEYRWAEYNNNRLPGLATELMRRQVTVIVAGGGMPSASAAKAATATIPIVFMVGVDPAQVGFVASLNKPGGNMTGVVSQNVAVGAKRLELLRELLPTASVVALLVNPTNPIVGEQFQRILEPAARTLGMRLHVLQASAESDFDAVFATLAQLRPNALVIEGDTTFNSLSEELAERAFHQTLPAIGPYRPFADAGGLVSYGASDTENYRLVGIQVGKILAGAKPADLPVMQSTKVELIVNLKTATAFHLAVPQSLLARADEVIE